MKQGEVHWSSIEGPALHYWFGPIYMFLCSINIPEGVECNSILFLILQLAVGELLWTSRIAMPGIEIGRCYAVL